MLIPDAIIEKAARALYAEAYDDVLRPFDEAHPSVREARTREIRVALEAVVSDIVAAAALCQHESSTGVDDTPMGDPWKVWRCDGCGWLHVYATNASHVARMVDVEAALDIVAARDQQWNEVLQSVKIPDSAWVDIRLIRAGVRALPDVKATRSNDNDSGSASSQIHDN